MKLSTIHLLVERCSTALTVTCLKIQFLYFIQEVFRIALWNDQQIGAFQGVRFEIGAANSLHFCDMVFLFFRLETRMEQGRVGVGDNTLNEKDQN